YAFDYSNIHFIDLDSMESDRKPDGPMARWLKADLAANKSGWTVAFWHHPPYTKGSHDSDTEDELIEMRENIVPILAQGGGDLAVSGHSHSDERSWFIDGYRGKSGDFRPSFVKQPGLGQEEEKGAYRKADVVPDPHSGEVFVVAGSSGQTGGGPLNHPV